MTHKEDELDEPVLPDDYPVYADYWYLVDNKPTRSPLHKKTALDLKKLLGAQEIRRCDFVGRMKQEGMI